MARGLTILALLLLATSPIILAQSEPPTPTPAVEYYAVETKVLDDGTSMDLVVINGPPTPPPGFEIERAAVPEHVAASAMLPVPAYDWSYGCSATSAAMISAYYDRTSYPNMYTGPTNGAVMPMDNSTWGHNTWPRCDGPGTVSVGECPLSATHNGIDGRSTRGHVDDYWIGYACPGPDPYVTNGWPEHTIGGCTGDYMETNKWYSAHGFNSDGGTVFFYYTSGAETYATTLEASGPPSSYDGGVGIKQFYESRGYVVTTAYNQYIKGHGSNPSLGFTYDQYKAEIDAGRPVMIHVEGHTMVGVGYDDSSSDLMYIHDTWDYSTHQMIWGNSYLGMQHIGVTIVQLQQYPDLSIAKRVVGPDPDPGDPVTFTLSIENIGSSIATNVVVTDTLSTDITLPSWANSPSLAGTTERGGVPYVWDLPDLAAGASGVITIYGTIDSPLPPGWTIVNWATIATSDQETDLGNNSSVAIVGGYRVYLPLVLRNSQ